jgi:fucose permease
MDADTAQPNFSLKQLVQQYTYVFVVYSVYVCVFVDVFFCCRNADKSSKRKDKSTNDVDSFAFDSNDKRFAALCIDCYLVYPKKNQHY